jgi:hypothetical protein
MRIQANDLAIGDTITSGPAHVRVRNVRHGDGGVLVTNPGAPDELEGNAWEWVDVDRPRRAYLDTEFDPRNPTLTGLLSLALTNNASPAEDYYAINTDADLGALADHSFIPDHVLPYLPVKVTRFSDKWIEQIVWDTDHPDFQKYARPAAQIAEDVAAYFTGEEPELFAKFGKDDLAYLHRLFGNDWNTMPPGVPRVFTDLEVLRRQLGAPEPPVQLADEHHALADARFNRDFHTHLLRFQAARTVELDDLARQLRNAVENRNPAATEAGYHRNTYGDAARMLLERFEVLHLPQAGQ